MLQKKYWWNLAMKYFNIPIFVPHLGCPFDCVFCNQLKITGADSDVDEKQVKMQIEEHIKMLPKDNCEIEIAFFGGSFTGIDRELQKRLLSVACEYVGRNNIVGIRVSTRPDYINDDILKMLTDFKVRTIELGVQSMKEDVLINANRGHTPQDVEKAVECILKYPIRLGLQMMTGLPGDDFSGSVYTAERIIALRPDFVRIYPTLVIENTRLSNMYKEGKYKPQTVDEAVGLCARLVGMFESAGIRVIRVGLQNTEEICENGSVVAGPFHSAFGELVESRLFYEKIEKAVEDIEEENIEIYVNSKEVSKVVGQKRENIEKAKNVLSKNIVIKGRDIVNKGEIKINKRW